MDNEQANFIENVDCVTINGISITPAKAQSWVDEQRKKFFDLPLIATPIVAESKNVLHPEKLSAEKAYQLDTAPYILTGGVSGEERFHNEFDYLSALIRAVQDNADQLSKLKRRTIKAANTLRVRYNQCYNAAIVEVGLKTMGQNETVRNAWFNNRYPGLCQVCAIYDGFLEEINTELERWRDFGKSASRELTSQENSYRASGKMYDMRSGKYDA